MKDTSGGSFRVFFSGFFNCFFSIGPFRLADRLSGAVLPDDNGKPGIDRIGRRLDPHGKMIEKDLQRKTALTQRFLIDGGGDQAGLKHRYLLFHQVVGNDSDFPVSDRFADGVAGAVIAGIYQIDDADVRMSRDDFSDGVITVKLVAVEQGVFHDLHMGIMGGKFVAKTGHTVFEAGEVGNF